MNNAELFERSKKIVPGGVHSPVRSFKGMPLGPRFFQKAQGAYFTDVEGKSYLDFCLSFGPLILGHAPAVVREAMEQQISRGWSYGACEPYSLELAEYILKGLPYGEMLRFVNSGTEAVMTALRLAKGYTGRNKIIKFNGCYHGHVDSMLIKAGSGLAGQAEASSLGVSSQVAQETLVVDLDDLPQLELCFKTHGSDVAAVIIEPIPANNGLLIQNLEFLQGIRRLCDQYGTLLIFDEVISGFRLGFGGMAEKLQIRPDILTYGKILGGGLPVGALVSTKKIMENLSPIGRVYQAGTLSANPLAMVAGLATLKQLTKENYQRLEMLTEQVVNLFKQWLNQFYPEMDIIQCSSLFWITSKGETPRSLKHIPTNQEQGFSPIFFDLLQRGIYLAPNAYEVGFMSLAHDEKVLDDLKQRLWV